MNIRPFLSTAQKFAIQNSPTILTAVAALGAVTTSVLAARAGYSSALLLQEANDPPRMQGEDIEPLNGRQKIEIVWKEFVPPAVVGALTLAAIIGANRIGTRRAAALAAAFSMSERAAEEYRQKVVQHMGDKKEEMVRSEVARDRIQRVDGVDTIVLDGAEILFYDSWSDRVFTSTRDRVESAVNQINYNINQQWAASLTEFFDLLGLNKTAVSDDFGWNSDELLSVYYTSCLLPNGKPACEIRYNINPFQGFSKVGH